MKAKCVNRRSLKWQELSVCGGGRWSLRWIPQTAVNTRSPWCLNTYLVEANSRALWLEQAILFMCACVLQQKCQNLFLRFLHLLKSYLLNICGIENLIPLTLYQNLEVATVLGELSLSCRLETRDFLAKNCGPHWLKAWTLQACQLMAIWICEAFLGGLYTCYYKFPIVISRSLMVIYFIFYM